MVLAQVDVRVDGHHSLPMSHKERRGAEMKGKSQNERAEELGHKICVLVMTQSLPS